MDILSDESSEDEIFFGKLTMKEIKKRLLPPLPVINHRQTVDVIRADCKDDTNHSIKIIETHSAPDISPHGDLQPTTVNKADSTPDLSPATLFAWDIEPDDSFLKLEQMVASMCTTPEKPEVLENVETKKHVCPNQLFSLAEVMKKPEQESNPLDGIPKLLIKSDVDDVTLATEESLNMVFKTPLKNNYVTKSKLLDTPHELFMTPLNELKSKVPIFKTLGNPPSHKKQLATPRKYQNVVSPVATYIRNSPQVPLLKNICPNRPLPGVSSIPKPLKNLAQLNKENVKQESVKPIQKQVMKLPAVAYRNAKETKMINIPDERKMPHNQWAKQVASSIPKALVVKHSHRETSLAKKCLLTSQENSFADLSLHQADLSLNAYNQQVN